MNGIKVNHALSVLGMFSEMKRRRFICDFWIQVDDEAIPAHRAVLAASSDFFVKLFTRDIESSSNSFRLQDLNSVAVAKCIGFMYTGSAHVTIQNVRQVLQAAKALKIQGLVEICRRYLEDSISLGTCFEIREIAKEFSISPLKYAAERYTDQNFDLVIKSSGFQSLDFEEVIELMMRSLSHVQKWEVVVTWVQGCVEERRCYLGDMLKIILSEKCPFDFIYTKMLFHQLVELSVEWSGLVAEGLFKVIAPFNVSLCNCFDVLQVARMYEEQCPTEVLQSLRDFVASNFDSLGNTAGFRALDDVDLLEILSSENAMIHTAIDKWKAALLWVKSDLQRRKSQLVEILDRIHWKECPMDQFLTLVNGDCLVRKYEKSAYYAASILFSIMHDSDVNRLNWFHILQIANVYQTEASKSATEEILLFVSANFADISKQNYFGKLCKEHITHLVRSRFVRATSEEIQWNAMLRWVNRDVKSRKSDLLDILNSSSLKTWKFNFTYEFVYNSDLVQESRDCREAVVSSLIANLKEHDLFIQDCFELLDLAKQSKSEFSDQAIGRIRHFLGRNYEKIAKLPEFADLDPEDLFSVLDSETIRDCNEDVKWTSFFRWVTADEKHHEYLPTILLKLDLEQFSFRYLDTKIYRQGLVRSDPGCRELCISAMLSNMRYVDINLVNWYELLQLARTNEHEKSCEILSKIRQFMAANFSHIQKQAHFGRLEKEEILLMLNSPEIANTSPDEQLKGAYEWLSGDSRREDDAGSVFRCLKLEGFPFDLLYNNLNDDSMVRKSPELMEIFLGALQSSLKPSNINMENWHTLLRMARNNGMPRYAKIHQCTLKFIALRFEILCQRNLLRKLELDDIWAVLRSSELHVSEVIRAQAILSWVKGDEGARCACLPDLLRLVKLQDVPNQYLKRMHADQMVNDFAECKDMILDALFAKDQQENGHHQPGS